jgi:hypothetical protein
MDLVFNSERFITNPHDNEMAVSVDPMKGTFKLGMKSNLNLNVWNKEAI